MGENSDEQDGLTEDEIAAKKLQQSTRTETVDFKIYDVPVELKNKYISLAKLDYDNQVWKVLERGMELINDERRTKVQRLQEQIAELNERIDTLERTVNDFVKEEKGNGDVDAPTTLGGDPPSSDKEHLKDLVE